MPSPTEVTVVQLSRPIGLPAAPALVDVRAEAEYQADLPVHVNRIRVAAVIVHEVAIALTPSGREQRVGVGP